MSRSKHASRRRCDCGRPLGDEFLCRDCASKLTAILDGMPGRIAEVEDTAYRLDHVTAPSGGSSTKGKVRPLPYRLEVGELLDKARNMLTTWARDVLEHRGIRDQRVPVGTAALCAWLSKAVPSIVLSPQAADMLADVARLDSELLTAIDLPPIPIYLGPCDECAQPMYARRGDREHQCRTCDREPYDVAAQVEFLLARSRLVVASPATIATALTSLDQPVTEELIWKWKQRGRLVPIKSDTRNRPLYRVGDVLDLLDPEQRKTERATRKWADTPLAAS